MAEMVSRAQQQDGTVRCAPGQYSPVPAFHDFELACRHIWLPCVLNLLQYSDIMVRKPVRSSPLPQQREI